MKELQSFAAQTEASDASDLFERYFPQRWALWKSNQMKAIA